MIRVALAGILGRKLRTVLTALAIVLGVAMVSGTFVLTDSIQKAFNFINGEVRAGSDVVVSGKSAFDLSNGGNGSFAPTIPASLLTKLKALPDVAAAQGNVSNSSTSLVLDGKAIAFGGAPNLGFSVTGGSPFNPLTLVSGTWPHGDEVVIDSNTASKKHLQVGETVGVQTLGPVEQFRISGTVELGSSSSIGGATLAGFDLPTAQRLFEKPGKFDEIALAGKPGVTPERLLSEVKPVLPPSAQARTGAQQAAKDAADTDSFISFLRDFLLAFGGIALFVGSFVIANSLSITIAQRTRELATLRTLGASRRQVLNLIFVESLVMGVLASVTGLFAGLGLAEAAVQALRRGRVHAAEQRDRVRHPHGRDRAARRHPRDARREPATGVPRNARRADRRRPRGRDAAAVAVRPLSLGRLGHPDDLGLRGPPRSGCSCRISARPPSSRTWASGRS